MGPSEKPFGELMREVRKARGMTQLELAELLGVAQPFISSIERGERDSSKPLKKLFYEKMQIQEPQASGLSAPPTPRSAAGPVLLDEIKAAHEELGRPLSEIELAAWSAAKEEELVAESALLREALELRTKRELLAAAKASRQRWEAKAHGK